jgi:hypothetical protein
VLAWTLSKTGDRLEVKATYNLKLKRTAAGWRFAYMGVNPLIPQAA